MKKAIIDYILILIILPAIMFSCTQADHQKEQTVNTPVADTTPRVTGIGGIFFLAEDPDSLSEWYGNHLGLAIDPYGSPFEFRNTLRPEEINYLRWSPFPDSSTYFSPSGKKFMINYRVNNLEGLLRKLEASGVRVLDEVMEVEYGKFVHILDPEGNKIELWEPVDSVLTQMGGETTK